MKLFDILINETLCNGFVWPNGACVCRQYSPEFNGKTAFTRHDGTLVREIMLPIADDASLFNSVTHLDYQKSIIGENL